jgi:hypothetical protein
MMYSNSANTLRVAYPFIHSSTHFVTVGEVAQEHNPLFSLWLNGLDSFGYGGERLQTWGSGGGFPYRELRG